MATMYKTMQTAILGGNVDQLKEICTRNSNDADCDAQLSRAYAELKHRNIPLSDEMIHFVEYELVKASYRNAAIAYQGGESSSTAKSTDVAQQRIAHMVKCIDLIVCQHQVDSYTDVDDLLVLRLRHVYAHVFFLKTHLRRLPLLQMQFCIAVFLKLVTGQAINGFEIYAFTIDIERLIRFLKLIRNALTNEQKPAIDLQCYVQYVQQVWHSSAGKQLSSVPKRIRTYIQMQLNSLKLSILESLEKDIAFENFHCPCSKR
ncbi:uncharacterized protein LOC121603148 [Anopheles merus]|uniref:uncharacterized protein LOC121603148 n=1 Tax=Anopheles merus TaxID=30066 RepID=UPI001BE4B891|nr:uncharacterized protein LOC121603148 [Anopheles merus]